MTWIRRLFRPNAPAPRPMRVPGANRHGATSAHLWWQGVTEGPWRSVSATIEVLTEPRVDSLYFWALQASFTDAMGQHHGAAHTGLQWNPRHPQHRAVNWGGYARTRDTSSVLDGTDSPLPGIPGDRNTRNFPWRAGVPYRFTIDRGPVGWRATVTDIAAGEATVVRELHAPGDRLGGFVMWMEIFADCDAPTTCVRWSDLEVTDPWTGARQAVKSVRTNFPDGPGNCLNNDSRLDVVGAGWLQLTNDVRTSRSASILTLA